MPYAKLLATLIWDFRFFIDDIDDSYASFVDRDVWIG